MKLPEPYASRLRRLLNKFRDSSIRWRTGILREGDCFCPEGMICELYHQETGEGEWHKRVNDRYTFQAPKCSMQHTIAHSVVYEYFFGYSSRDVIPYYRRPSSSSSFDQLPEGSLIPLSVAFDNGVYSITEMADKLEEMYL